MRRLLLAVLLSPLRAVAADAPDPYLWLEDIEGPKALEWVEAHNAQSLPELQGDPRYAGLEAEVRKIVLAEDRIPWPELRGGEVYNFWQDSTSVRGLWRRTSLKEYAKPAPRWETVIDLDRLSKDEGENWVWHGANCLPTKGDRCLVELSKGGKDAAVVREFDLKKKAFVKDGFRLEEAKSDYTWVDRDTLLVGTDFGPASLTDSGYPRIVKKWRRGTALSSAQTVFECETTDVSCSSATYFRPDGAVTMVFRSKTFFSGEQYVLSATGALEANPMPDDVDFQGVYDGRLFGLLRTPWKTGAGELASGTLIALPIAGGAPETVFAPDERSAYQSLGVARGALLLNVLRNVEGQVLRAAREGSQWTLSPVPMPEHGVASVISVDAFETVALAQYQSWLSPSSVRSFDARQGGEPAVLRSLPARFDAAGLTVDVFEATSADGTRVPYSVIRSTGAQAGPRPTLLYGYGGFEIALTPSYLEVPGKTWLEKGNVYVVANIRGGGEFGPRWHQAALKTNRQRAYDDFLAVAEDLVRRKITEPRRLGISGRSNGGLLVATAFTQRPDLFRAVVCGVPLADMLRYTKLLAGASWMGEYGDPDVPEERKAIVGYAPYQNLRSGKSYPRVYFYTSTKDDRVHPGHARKMVARMEELGYPVLYYENTEGGHSAAANLEQRVKKTALEYIYLVRMLAD